MLQTQFFSFPARIDALKTVLLMGGCLLGLTLSQVYAQGGGQTLPRPTGVGHTVRGKIFLPSGQTPDYRIRVVMELTTGGITGDSFTDTVGNFEFRQVSNGNYTLTVKGDGRNFETTQERLEVASNVARTFTAILYLRDKKSDDAGAASQKILSVAEMQQVPKAARKSYEKGVKLFEEAKLPDALVKLREALAAAPAYLLALNKLGEVQVEMGQRQDAQASFEQALSLNPKFILPQINLGSLALALERYAQAVEYFETVNRQDDTFFVSHLNLGLALMRLAPPDYERAEKELQRALSLGGAKVPQVHMHLFNLYVRQRQYAKAVTALEGYLRDAPNAPDAAQVQQRLAALRKALEQAPPASQPTSKPPLE